MNTAVKKIKDHDEAADDIIVNIRINRAKANDFIVIEKSVTGTTREKYRKIETPFDQALRHGWISKNQHQALESLCVSLQRGGILPHVTMNWSQFLDGSRKNDISEARQRHMSRFRSAISALPLMYRDGFLTWFISAQHEYVSIHDLGSYFTDMKHKEARKAVGVLVLQICSGIISNDLGFSEKN